MELRLGLTELVMGVLFLILAILYLNYPQNVLLSLFCLIPIITGIFGLKGYYHKIIYLAIITVILVVMGIVAYYNQVYVSNIDKTEYYVQIGFGILIIASFVISTLREWDKFQALEYYDKLLAINPNDTIALNNKGVELTSQKKYEKAAKCFDKVLELDPEDTAALHNKNFIEKYHKNRTFADKFEIGPKLEITDKAGSLFLGRK